MQIQQKIKVRYVNKLFISRQNPVNDYRKSNYYTRRTILTQIQLFLFYFNWKFLFTHVLFKYVLLLETFECVIEY